jgi:adenylosuccinate synthase
LVVTKLDVFDTHAEIQLCTGYRHKGSKIAEMPAEVEALAEVTPEYKTLPGWRSPTDHIREADKLPQAARDYLSFISDSLGVEIGMISTGPERDSTIIRTGTKLASWL